MVVVVLNIYRSNSRVANVEMSPIDLTMSFYYICQVIAKHPHRNNIPIWCEKDSSYKKANEIGPR